MFFVFQSLAWACVWSPTWKKANGWKPNKQKPLYVLFKLWSCVFVLCKHFIRIITGQWGYQQPFQKKLYFFLCWCFHMNAFPKRIKQRKPQKPQRNEEKKERKNKNITKCVGLIWSTHLLTVDVNSLFKTFL